MELPPPKPMMQSALTARARSQAASTMLSSGSAATSVKQSSAMPCCWKADLTSSSRPSLLIPGSVTSNTERAASSRQNSGKRLLAPCCTSKRLGARKSKSMILHLGLGQQVSGVLLAVTGRVVTVDQPDHERELFTERQVLHGKAHVRLLAGEALRFIGESSIVL